MAATVVHLMRHGEVHNPSGVLYGRLPGFRLSDQGERQAGAVAGWLRGRDVTHVVCSPLERARQTAAIVAGPHGLPVTVDDRLTETANVFEGRRVGLGDVAWTDPRAWRHLYNPFRPSWSESFVDIARRMLAALNQARLAATGHEAVCVSHQLPIWTLRRRCEGRPLWHNPRRRRCSVASLTSFEFVDDELRGLRYQEHT